METQELQSQHSTAILLLDPAASSVHLSAQTSIKALGRSIVSLLRDLSSGHWLPNVTICDRLDSQPTARRAEDVCAFNPIVWLCALAESVDPAS